MEAGKAARLLGILPMTDIVMEGLAAQVISLGMLVLLP